jgi:hypothetical protein
MSAGVRPNLKSLVINVAEPAPYPLLRRIVSAHQARPGFSASGRTFRDALLRTLHCRRFSWLRVTTSTAGAKSRPCPSGCIRTMRGEAPVQAGGFPLVVTCDPARPGTRLD